MSGANHRTTIALARNQWKWALIGVLFVLYAIVSICNGWLVDDAYITFRVSDNLVNGYGARWNIVERVQVYTHPLWMLLFTSVHFITREIYLTAIMLSWIVSLFCVAITILRLIPSFRGRVFALTAFILSKSFMDYSSSGLENPLTHLLLTLFLWIFFSSQESRWRILLLSTVASLAIVNRHDSILLMLPTLLWAAWQHRAWRTLGLLFIGGTPLIIWECFSLAYYGFLVPNTAWAKLNTGIPRQFIGQTAINYFLQSVMYDHTTLFIIIGAVIAALVVRKYPYWTFIIGLTLHLLYIYRIGGDFMSGRFFSSAFLLAVILLGRLDWHSLPRRSWVLILSVICIAGLTNPFPTVFVNRDSGKAEELAAFNVYRNVKDERAFYYRYTGLLAGIGKSRWPDSPWRTMGENLRESKTKAFEFYAIGLLGYYAGPDVHIVDVMALSDPLLARLQFYGTERQGMLLGIQTHPDFMPGHLERARPVGYLETLAKGENHIEDPHLREYYEQLCIVTRGPIWTRERWRTIWKLNTGGLDDLLDRYENPSKHGSR